MDKDELDEEMVSDKSSSGSSGDDSEDEESSLIESDEIQQTRLRLTENPYSYNDHIKLIDELKKRPDLTKLRQARQEMAKLFPLTETLWLEWFTDEMPLAVIQEQKLFLISLFEKAVNDYLSVRVWVQYCQFMVDGIESSEGLKIVRDVFEKAIVAAGLHVIDGSAIWSGYRELEMSILQSYQQLQDAEDNADIENKVDAQIERVANLFKRQVSIPLLGIEDTMEEFENWSSNPISDEIRNAYQRALEKLKSLVPFEEKLKNAEWTKLEAFQEYIEYEISMKDPARIQLIFERSIVENCLNSEIWLQYIKYLIENLKIKSVILPVFERAIKNCPWVSQIWQLYICTLQEYNLKQEEVKAVFEQGLAAGFGTEDEYLQLWLTYIGYLRGLVTNSDDTNKMVKDLLAAYKDSINYMTTYFTDASPSVADLSLFYADALDAKYGYQEQAKEYWDKLSKNSSKSSIFWISLANALCRNKHYDRCRRVFQRAIQISVDDPVSLCKAYLNFEHMEGSLLDISNAMKRSKNLLDRMQRKEEKLNEQKAMEDNRRGKKADTSASTKQKPRKIGEKRSHNKDVKLEPKANKKHGNTVKEHPKQNVNASKTPSSRSNDMEDGEPTFKKPRKLSSDHGQGFGSNTGPTLQDQQGQNEKEKNENIVAKTDEEKQQELEKEQPYRVFLSNLLFSADEEAIKKVFESCGKIDDVTIIKNHLGRSKGYAYVKFNSQDAVAEALKLDRQLLSGRPIFVAPDNPEKRFEFKFSTRLDRSTLFVANLPFDITDDEVKEYFSNAGEVKEVRLVTNRAGKPKGYGYVEFAKEADASSAVFKMNNTELKGMTLEVALSNPPKRKMPGALKYERQPIETKPLPGFRGKSKTQVSLLPRSVNKAPAKVPKSADAHSKESSDTSTSKLSNDDFRKLLGK